jgi:UDP-glucuronate 4-epimerase
VISWEDPDLLYYRSVYLVTGVAGFIGARVAERLIVAGCRVIGIDNLNEFYDLRLKKHRLGKLRKYANFSFKELDIEDRKALDCNLGSEKINGVLHLAARAGVRYSIENPQAYMMTNALGTLNLLEFMVSHGIRKMVLASTSSLYAGQKMPFLEESPVDRPISPYAATKKSAEAMAYTYSFVHKLDISVVRYFTVFGPCGRPDMSVFRFIKCIDEGKPIDVYGDGTQSRDFTYIDDVVSGTIAALKEVGYEIINIGGGNPSTTLKTMISWIEELLGKQASIEFHPISKTDMMSTWADIRKAESLLGWKPKTTVKEGLELTVEWHRENSDWLREVELSMVSRKQNVTDL